MGYVPRGPLVDWDDLDQVTEIRDRLIALARASGMQFVKIEPDLEDLPLNRLVLRQLGFQPSTHTIQPRSTIRVDLTVPEDEIMARMKSKWRYNIRKAYRSGTQVRVGTPEDVETFQGLMEETGARQGFSPHSQAYHETALEALGPDALRLLLADVEDDTVAAIAVAAVGRGAWDLWAASSIRQRKAMPNYALHHAAMLWARAQGAEYYDFWGIPEDLGSLARHIRWFSENREWPSTLPVDLGQLPLRDMWSVYRMKQGFGGRIIHLVGAWDLPIRPPAYRIYLMATRAQHQVRQVRKQVQGQWQTAKPAAPVRPWHLEKTRIRQNWNRDLMQVPEANFMQSWEWGEAKAQFGWEPVRYRLRAADGSCAGTMQILVKRLQASLPLKVAYIPRGPAIDWTDRALVAYTLEAIESLVRREGFLAVRLDPNLRRDQAPGMAAITQLEERHWHFSERPTQIQNTGQSLLHADPEALMAAVRSRGRNKIRLTRRRGITIRQGTPADLPQFYDLYLETGQRKGFGIRSFNYYQTVLAQCNLQAEPTPHGLRSTLLLAEDQEVGVVGAACLLALGPWAWYLYGASGRSPAGTHPNHLLQWEAMRWATAQGCRYYDWWGAPLDPDDPEDALHGVWRFKQELGAQFKPLIGAWDYYTLPGSARCAPYLRQALARHRPVRFGGLPV